MRSRYEAKVIPSMVRAMADRSRLIPSVVTARSQKRLSLKEFEIPQVSLSTAFAKTTTTAVWTMAASALHHRASDFSNTILPRLLQIYAGSPAVPSRP